MDRIDLELRESPAAPDNETSAGCVEDSLVWIALSSTMSGTWWNTSEGVR